MKDILFSARSRCWFVYVGLVVCIASSFYPAGYVTAYFKTVPVFGFNALPLDYTVPASANKESFPPLVPQLQAQQTHTGTALVEIQTQTIYTSAVNTKNQRRTLHFSLFDSS